MPELSPSASPCLSICRKIYCYSIAQRGGNGNSPAAAEKFFIFSPTPLHFVSEYGTIIKPLPRRPTQNSTRSGRLAQLVEHLLDVQEVTGSSPVPSTKTKPRGNRPRVFVLHGHRRGAPGSSPVLLRKRGAACGRSSRAGAGAASEFSSALHARRKFRAPQPDPPNKAYPNPILYEEGFGYVFSLPEVMRHTHRTTTTA